MTAFQRIVIHTGRWNETVITPSFAKPHELICAPNTSVLMNHILSSKQSVDAEGKPNFQSF